MLVERGAIMFSFVCIYIYIYIYIVYEGNMVIKEKKQYNCNFTLVKTLGSYSL